MREVSGSTFNMAGRSPRRVVLVFPGRQPVGVAETLSTCTENFAVPLSTDVTVTVSPIVEPSSAVSVHRSVAPTVASRLFGQLTDFGAWPTCWVSASLACCSTSV